MPLARAVLLAIMAIMTMAMGACVTAELVPDASPAPERSGTARMPREIRAGAAEMMLQSVERDVAAEEVAAAIRPLLANAPICMAWPALWMEQARRSSFVVRYDLMARDWGEGSVAAAQSRMQEFVELGFLTASPGPSAGSVQYTMTEAGFQYLVGVIEPGRRPRFCAPAERELVEITSMEWGRFPCGSLRVQFMHVGRDWPSWARSETTRTRLAASWPALGEPAQGAVSLSRQWYERRNLPPGFQNGMLRSACYDADRQQVVGSDLNLMARDLD